jgi:hypothetical protein
MYLLSDNEVLVLTRKTLVWSVDASIMHADYESKSYAA